MSRWGLLLIHAGRISIYGLLGIAMENFRESLGRVLPNQFHQVQGGIALVVTCLAAYLALALLGRVPSPEILFARLIQTWGRAVRKLTASPPPLIAASPLFFFTFGLLWGLLPCGMIFSALLMAAIAGSPLQGALYMLAFGLGTLPALIGVDLLGRRAQFAGTTWPRRAAAFAITIFGVQMLLRGLAAWGVIAHYHIHVVGLALW